MTVEEFILRWTAREGGAERANYQMFLAELCEVLGVARPEPAGAEREHNDYVFERAVRSRESEGLASSRRIDLYKKGCFILEAKQSRLPGQKKSIGPLPPACDPPAELGRRGLAKGWDVMMQNARRQAEAYVFLLDADHPAPPFLITCDVGNAFEIFADFTGTGRAYSQFPDRNSFRMSLEDLRDPAKQTLLAKIWTDPASLDPARESARVTRGVASRLAAVSKALEAEGHDPEAVAHFLMRCLFTMFAEDVGLLPPDCFKTLLRRSTEEPDHFGHRLASLWQAMQAGADWNGTIDAPVRRFNGGLFKNTHVFALGRAEIGALLAAAKARWTDVDPAIFGTLLEQALEPAERRKLGAHYTPRAYVQRLVEVTVMEPLRADWQRALTRAEAATEAGDAKGAIRLVRDFHHQLCATRVLDPACGTGNFLYVSLELMKTLEGEVLETLARLGAPERLGLDRESVDPHQFLGLELNPRAAAIAELVVWIGYLQQHYRTRSGHPNEPILKAFGNINFGRPEGYDAVLAWNGETPDGATRPAWPEAEFIVGNPPFIGKGAAMRGALGDAYVEALSQAHPKVNESADFVMYWWDRAAQELTREGAVLRRFGLVTTNSISQVFNRRVIAAHQGAQTPVAIVFAIPDHPWTKATRDAASVRIAMTVAEASAEAGALWEVVGEADLESDNPIIDFKKSTGVLNADLTVGANVTKATVLRANSGLSCNGVMLAGKGFVLSQREAETLGEGELGQGRIIRAYVNGGELTGHPRRRFVIDAFDRDEAGLRSTYPRIYQHLLGTVKPERMLNRRPAFRKSWWVFGEPRKTFRPALSDLDRYIGTTESAKHRIFQFIDGHVLPDHMIIVIASDDAWVLAVLSSRAHTAWALAAGGWLGLGNDPRYSKSRTFDPFPFPDPAPALRQRLRAAGEELDGLRKRVLAEHGDLTMTGLYNVLEKLRSGAPLGAKDEDVKARGLVLILKELHETIDRLTAEAYGWPQGLAEAEILERLVALNAERAREEAAGHVRWLRPDYQIARFSRGPSAQTGELDLPDNVVMLGADIRDRGLPAWPRDRYEQPLAIEALLAAAGRPMAADEIARGFKNGGKRIEGRTAQGLATLALYGRVTALPGQRFAARRAA